MSCGWLPTWHRSGRICDTMRCVGETDRGLDRTVSSAVGTLQRYQPSGRCAIPWQHACTSVHIDVAWDTFVISCDGHLYRCLPGDSRAHTVVLVERLPCLAQGLFHWSRLSEIHTELLVARYTVAGVPVVIHVLAPQVQVNVPVVAVVKDLLEQVDLPEVLVVHVSGAGRCHRCDVVQVSLGCCGGTVLSQSQIVAKSAHVLYIEHCHV